MKRKLLAIILITAVALSLFGCGSADGSVSEFYSSASSSPEMYDYEAKEAEGNFQSSNGEFAGIEDTSERTGFEGVADRKIIVTVDYWLETKSFEDTLNAILTQTETLGGYIASSDVNTNPTRGQKSAYLELRIPAAKLDSFSQYVEDQGNVLNKSQGGEDVTLQYYDTENQLHSLEIQQERLLELLEKAETMEDILAIESELTRVRTEIESLTTMLKRLDNLVDYATVSINLQEVEIYEDPAPETFGDKLGNAFKNSFSSALETLKDICIGLIWMLPYLAVIAVIIIVIIVLVKNRRKKRAAANNQMHQQLPAPESDKQMK